MEDCVLEQDESQEQLEIRQFDQYFSDLVDVIKVHDCEKASVCVERQDSGSLDTQDSKNEGNELNKVKRRSSFFSSFVEGLKIQCKAYLETKLN